mgnify:CR=1 FL=1
MSRKINSSQSSLPNSLPVGALSRRSGIPVSAIRFYEREGLLTASRNAIGHRRYGRASLRILAIIKAGQQAGIPLAEIRTALGPAVNGLPLDRDRWRRISEGWRADLDRRIHLLRNVRDRLSDCIGCGCLSLEACALYNPIDQAGEKGPGPRYLMGDEPAA